MDASYWSGIEGALLTVTPPVVVDGGTTLVDGSAFSPGIARFSFPDLGNIKGRAGPVAPECLEEW